MCVWGQGGGGGGGGGGGAQILPIVKLNDQFILSTKSVHPVYAESLHKLDSQSTA